MTAGRIHLCGGGWDDERSGAHAPFFAEATERSSTGEPRIVVLLWAATAAEGERWHQPYLDRYTALGPCRVDIVQLTEDRPLGASDVENADGLVVGGGPTPGYHAAITPEVEVVRELIATGVPYSGASAGAMIASSRALVGGRTVDGIAVAPDKTSDGIGEVTVLPGLGLVEPTVDVHIAQYGTLGRITALVESNLTADAIGIDEDTVLVVDGDSASVVGSGCVWRARRSPELADPVGVVITRHRPGDQPWITP